jgi:hypothetical protein
VIEEEGKKGWWVEKATGCVWAKRGRGGGNGGEGPSTPAAAGAAEVANASNCGHFIIISRTCESPPPLEEE